MKAIAVGILALALATPVAAAQIGAANQTTRVYFKDCRQNEACRKGILTEIYDYDPTEECVPGDEPVASLVEKVLTWIERHPERADDDAWETTNSALKELWPCG